jgi:hypothetical protein
MKQQASQHRFLSPIVRSGLSVICAVLLVPGELALRAEPAGMPIPAPQEDAPKIPNDQLDSLVAPIALYPDPLLAQVLAACTYPLEIIQLQQWLGQHKDLKDKALADAVAKQDWDPSVQGLAGLPDVVKRLADNIAYTTDLGNAFLAQQSDVMDAVQRMRAKAQEKGNLTSNEQMKVETKVVESKQVIVVEQANPQVVYVPSYDPVVVYGAPAYPYPAGYYAAGMALSFGVGVAMGAMWSGGWGYNCGWSGGNNNVNINNNNSFNRSSNVGGGNRNDIGGGNRGNRPSQQPSRGGGNRGQGGNWQHNPQHRGGTPYSNKGTADRFGGTTRGSSQAARQNSARQNVGRQQASGREFGGPSGGGAGGRQQAGTMDRGGAGGGRQQAGTGNRAGGGAGGGADRIGNRSASSGSGSRGGGSSAFGGGGRASSGSGARASSSRGGSSMGGGGRGGGGGRRR